MHNRVDSDLITLLSLTRNGINAVTSTIQNAEKVPKLCANYASGGYVFDFIQHVLIKKHTKVIFSQIEKVTAVVECGVASCFSAYEQL